MATKYTPEDYDALDCDEYRARFPVETKQLTDKQLFNLIMSTEDDMEDEEWRMYFMKNTSAKAG